MKSTDAGYIVLLAIITGLFSSPLRAWTETDDNERPFTIRDSIELSYIVDPAKSTMIEMRGAQPVGGPIYSPDGNYFLLVTQRGILSANALEGTIWLFDAAAVSHYAMGKLSTKPTPRKLATVSATSNLPVITDVRWIEGSKTVAFLGKDGSPFQRLFEANVETGSVRPVTTASLYVTAYDIRGNTVAYTALTNGGDATRPGFDEELIDVGQRNAFELLYRNIPSIEDLEEGVLIRSPNSLHIKKGEHEIRVKFTMADCPLTVFVPTIALSPDSKLLVTVAPVREVPKDWEKYAPPPLYERFFRLKSGPVQEKGLMDIASYWRPEQYVLINLETGVVSPLVDAPAGRDLGYGDVPSEAFWFDDNRHVLLTNTYLPFSKSSDKHSNEQRTEGPAAAIVDAPRGEVQGSVRLRKNPPHYGIRDIKWDHAKQVLTISYEAAKDEITPFPESYLLRSGTWVRFQATNRERNLESGNDVQLSIDQDLNHPPMLWARIPGKTAVLAWNPNSQLGAVRLGNASIYRWNDRNGRAWSGILVVPSDYDARLSYPLVIQTHGYDADKFFADGKYTTGNGGRALVAKDIIVLQIEDFHLHMYSPTESPDNVAGFQSAIDHLVADHSVDRRRIGVIGFSRTSHYVLDALTHQPDLFAAAMTTNPIEGYVWYVMNLGQADLQGIAEDELGGVPVADGLMNWFKNAPNFNLDKVRAPLLITATERGGLIGEWETYSLLRRMNKPVDMLWWWKENTPHILVQPAQRYASQQAAVDWFDFWLNGHEDPDLSKAKRYRRWEELRKLRKPSKSVDLSGVD